LRIYTITYDSDDPTEIGTLVYAEDLSRNGTFWHGSLIGRGRGGFLLSEDDILKLSAEVSFRFKMPYPREQKSYFDEVLDEEMEVSWCFPRH
jgi:hypothetical protein